jgi:putative N6-adenine-specific DNA methylase
VNQKLGFFAACPRGAEEFLTTELKSFGATDILATGGGVSFNGTAQVGWHANLASRIASRVLQRLSSGFYHSTDDLYALAKSTAWELFHDSQATLRVDVSATRSPLQSLQFATLRIKDGICDRYRDIDGQRPSIDTQNPTRRVLAHVTANQCTLYLDWSGDSLFKRGWRRDANDAPLKENLAATLLMVAGLPDQRPQAIMDPFCGSGTLLIEAACMVRGMLPGGKRRFAFEDQLGFAATDWQRFRDKQMHLAQTRAAALKQPRIIGGDITPAALSIAIDNAARAGLPDNAIEFRQSDALHWQSPGESGVMVTNPPYGERLDMKGRKVIAQDERFWPEFGTLLKRQFNGWQAWLLTADLDLPGKIRLKPKRRTPLFNGPIECRAFCFDMYVGTKRVEAKLDNV